MSLSKRSRLWVSTADCGAASGACNQTKDTTAEPGRSEQHNPQTAQGLMLRPSCCILTPRLHRCGGGRGERHEPGRRQRTPPGRRAAGMRPSQAHVGSSPRSRTIAQEEAGPLAVCQARPVVLHVGVDLRYSMGLNERWGGRRGRRVRMRWRWGGRQRQAGRRRGVQAASAASTANCRAREAQHCIAAPARTMVSSCASLSRRCATQSSSWCRQLSAGSGTEARLAVSTRASEVCVGKGRGGRRMALPSRHPGWQQWGGQGALASGPPAPASPPPPLSPTHPGGP